MLLEQQQGIDWQGMNHLLLCCASVQALETLAPALQLLHQTLPETKMMILVSASDDLNSLQLPSIQITLVQDWFDQNQIEWLRQQCFDAAIIFTEPFRSPYFMAYLCYLAEIPIRVGQSQEFGGSVLSTCIIPPLEQVSLEAYHLHLLQASGAIDAESTTNKAFALRRSAI